MIDAIDDPFGRVKWVYARVTDVFSGASAQKV